MYFFISGNIIWEVYAAIFTAACKHYKKQKSSRTLAASIKNSQIVGQEVICTNLHGVILLDFLFLKENRFGGLVEKEADLH